MYLCRYPQMEAYLLISPIFLFFIVGFLLHKAVVAEIPFGSKLSVAESNYWVSSNGDFALSFFNTTGQPYQYSVGIRFNSESIPRSQQTVIWVAGADVTVGNESYFQLSEDGELVLFDSLTGVSAWTSESRNLSVVSAALHDNGNLVLLDAKQSIVWQSFDTPCDTLLPGQSLHVDKKLRAASKNSVSSYYTLYMNTSGQLQLRWQIHVVYWTSGAPTGSNLSAFVTSDGALQLREASSLPIWSAFGEDHNDSVRYRFVRLDVDGNLRLYSWTESSRSWQSVWQAVGNQCKVFAACSESGICSLTSWGSAKCTCPFDFSVQTNSRCLFSYQHECESGSNMFRYDNTFLYGIYPPGDSVRLTSLQQCEQLCFKDPLCTAATFTNDGSAQCWMKKSKYVSGYMDPSISSVSFVRRCSGPLAVNPNALNSSMAESPTEESSVICVPCLIGAASGTFFIFVLFQLGIGFYFYRRKKFLRNQAASCNNSKKLLLFTFSEIKDLTGNFKTKISPTMFKGILPNNQLVAVKALNASIEERRFRRAALKVGCLYHKNLLKLEGYCCESDHRYLVYEYVKNGSVDKYLDDPTLCKMLTWRKRLDICLSIAKTISYLHTGCREFISHRNLKCENVVLDEKLVAKVTEFGLGSLHGEPSSDEFAAEKDVEDFGKMILILLSGCRNEEGLCEWAYKEWIEGRAGNIVDKRIDGGMDLEELEGALRIAFWCLQGNERSRPSMGEVVTVLEGTLDVDPPPPPLSDYPWPLHRDDELEDRVHDIDSS